MTFFGSLRTLLLVVATSAWASAAEPNTLTPQEKGLGWKLLFDGKTLTGFRGVQKPDFLKAGWKIEDGALVLTKDIKNMGKVTGGDLITMESYADFEFSFEWRLAISGNSGVRYLVRGMVGGSPMGSEYQIVDDVRHPDGLKGGPTKRTASLYGILAPTSDKTVNDPPAWNEGRITVFGSQVEHWLNGAKMLEYTLGSPQLQAAVKASALKVKPSFWTRFPTPVVLLDEGEEVSFRSLKIHPISLK